MLELSKKLKVENFLVVNRNGKGGGLVMLQNTNVNVHITSFNSHHIDAQIQSKRGSWMRCTWIYGHPKMAQKKHTWTFLRRLVGLSNTHWLYFSDFNEILYMNEKIEGNDRSVNMIDHHRTSRVWEKPLNTRPNLATSL